MKHGLLISAMSFILVAGTGPSFAISPGPAALGLGSGAANEMAGQRFAQAQPGQGQQGGDQATPGSQRQKRSAQSQPSGQQPGEMGQQGQGEKMGQGAQPGGQKKKAQAGTSGQQGEKMGTQPGGQRKAAEGQQPSGQRKAGTSGEQSGSRMGAAGSKQPGVKGTVSGEAGVAAGGSAGAKGSASLTIQDRTKITTVIKEAKVQPIENVNFSISVGARVPREVHLFTLPAEVVAIHPVWRGFEYILVRNEIVVINPRTFVIVAVLPLA